MMRKTMWCAVCAAVVVLPWAQAGAIDDNAGTAGYSFLKIGVGARPAAMAEAYVGLADDYSALYYNPAGITGLRLSTPWADGTAPEPEEPATYVAAAYNSWLVDIQSGFLALVTPVHSGLWIGASIQYLDYGEFIGTDGQGTIQGNFGASDMAFALSVARRQRAGSGDLALGLTGRMILSSIDDSSSWGVAADLGAMYYLPDNRTQFGLAVTNMGAQMDGMTKSHKDKLPAQFAVGASHKLRGLPLILAGDLSKAIDDQVRFALGGELVSFAPFYLRTGYSSRRGDIETGSSNDGWAGFSGGLGVTHKHFRLDYAIGYLSELGTVHRVGLTARL